MKYLINERHIIDTLITRLDCSNGDAQSVYEAAEMTRPGLFDGSYSEEQVIDALCHKGRSCRLLGRSCRLLGRSCRLLVPVQVPKGKEIPMARKGFRTMSKKDFELFEKSSSAVRQRMFVLKSNY